MGMNETLDNTLKVQLIDKLAKENKQLPSKMKCPQNPKVELIWKDFCSFSGHHYCRKCIKKGDYPKN